MYICNRTLFNVKMCQFLTTWMNLESIFAKLNKSDKTTAPESYITQNLKTKAKQKQTLTAIGEQKVNCERGSE